jgi:uncharacterized protein (DUF952 family)
MTSVFLHALTLDDHGSFAADAAWQPRSLHAEGFIHLCTPAQLAGVRQRFFAAKDMVVLLLDAHAVTQHVRMEDTYGHGVFPHLYAPLNRAWVLRHVLVRAADALPGPAHWENTRLR